MKATEAYNEKLEIYLCFSHINPNTLITVKLWLISPLINWDKEFKNGSSKICGGQSLKNLKAYGLLSASH